MRLLYLDIDCLRADHLGCYGYHRATSPNIDALAAEGLRFDNVYASDVPCLPSRAALMSGRFGIHTGVVNHGGAQAEPFSEGRQRGFTSMAGRASFVRALRDRGFRTASVSSFAERHGAHFFHAGFHDIRNPGSRGLERADQVAAIAQHWLAEHARDDQWFLHVNFWDPHTPYRTHQDQAGWFADAPLPDWLTDDIRRAHFEGCGPHSARETMGYDDQPPAGIVWDFPAQPLCIDSPAALRRMFDGYDTGIRYADQFIGQLIATLAAAGVLDQTAILVSGDHGEALGELNVYGDHHNADQCTTRVPFIMRWPGVTDRLAGRAFSALHYQFDLAATAVELLGGATPPGWDAISFATALTRELDEGRDTLVLSQATWSCQRAVRFARQGGEYLCIRTYHDGHHGYPDTMLFEIASDPHQQQDLAAERPDVVCDALARLERWLAAAMQTATHPVDPFWVVLHEGGPKHIRGNLPRYLRRLRATGRARWADLLASRHPREQG